MTRFVYPSGQRFWQSGFRVYLGLHPSLEIGISLRNRHEVWRHLGIALRSPLVFWADGGKIQVNWNPPMLGWRGNREYLHLGYLRIDV